MIPLAFFLYIEALLIKIFDLYTKLEILSSKVISLYKRLSWTIYSWINYFFITISYQVAIISQMVGTYPFI